MLVSCAENGQAGLEMLRGGSRPCLILLDLQMPFLDGFGFRRQQLADPEIAEIPAVVMTGQANKELEARRLGISLYLRKPVAPARVVDVIGQYCGHVPLPLSFSAG
jgi:CheY-like chemotaxis protein